MKSCILFLTHTNSEFVQKQIDKLFNEVDQNLYDIFILKNSKDNSFYKNEYIFNEYTIKNHNFKMHYYYPGLIPFYGNNIEYSFMQFYLDYPYYDFYWLVEYDVYCNGNWNDVFTYYDQFKDVDLFTTHIDRGDHGNWLQSWLPLSNFKWINSFQYDSKTTFKCFNPIDRFSNKALNILIESYRKGDYGFYEIAMPTILYNNGCILRTFGKNTELGNNEFCHNGKKEYINDISVQFEHKYKLDELTESMVYHPFKGE